MRHVLMAGALLLTIILTFAGSVRGQELILRGTVETQPATAHEATPHAEPLPPMAYPHPTISSDGRWGGLMTSLILVFFVLAVLIGALTDIDRSYDSHRLRADDEADDAHGHHDATTPAHH